MDYNKAILDSVETLRSLLSQYSTKAVIDWCSAHNLNWANTDSIYDDLISPAKQKSFLISLLLATPEPAKEIEVDEGKWKEIIELLNQAFRAYQFIFWPSQEESKELSDEWRRVRDVMMPVFLHYFNTGLLATIEQVRERTNLYLAQFEEMINNEFGISVSDALHIADWIGRRSQTLLQSLSEIAIQGRELRLAFLDDAKQRGLSLDDLSDVVQASEYPAVAVEYHRLMDQFSTINLNILRKQFPAQGQIFWDMFTISRGTGDIQYPTDASIYDKRPLILLDENNAGCPSINALYNAILFGFEDFLSESKFQGRYYDFRAKALEQEICKSFQSIIGDGAGFYSNVFETSENQFEHDLIIKHNDVLLIIESKATPPKEPFRDPEKAFVRLSRAFNSDTGIQGAYNQAMRLWQCWNEGEAIELYNEGGTLIRSIDPTEIKKAYCICATRDDFGALATNLSLLLKKDSTEPFPWVVNVFDLQTLAEAWLYFKWGPNEFYDFLDGRLKVHGTVFTTDEMVMAGFYIAHGRLDELLKYGADLIPLNDDYSSVFDKIYRNIYQGGPPVERSISKPFAMDLRESLIADQPVEVVLPSTKSQKQGRNERCACGSGKKYKRCCGL